MARDTVQVDIVTNTQKSSANLLKYAAVVAGATIAVKKLVDVGSKLVKAASDQEEIYSKFNVVFKQNAQAVQGWARQYSRAMGRSTTDTMEYLASIQDTLVPLGFMRDEASEMSQQVVELSNDLASFNNMDTADVMRDIQSAIVGNTETLRKYGVVASQAAIEQYALENGLWDGVDAMDAQTKAAAILALTMQGTADAQGDLARTQDSFANVSRAIQSAFQEIREAAGGALMEALSPMAIRLRDWLYENLDTITAIFSNIPEVLGIVFQTAADIGKKLMSWDGFKATITALAEGLAKNIASAWQVSMGIARALWDGMFGIITSIGQYTISVFANAWAHVRNFAVDKLAGIFEFFGAEIERSAVPQIQTFGDAWDGAIAHAGEAISDVAGLVAEGVGSYAQNSRETIRAVGDVFSDELSGMRGEIGRLVEAHKAAGDEMEGGLAGDGDTTQIDATTQAFVDRTVVMEEMVAMQQAYAAAIQETDDKERQLIMSQQELAETMLGPQVEAFAVLGQAITDASMSWGDYAKASVLAVADTLSAIAQAAFAQAAVLFFTPGSQGLAGGLLAAAVGAQVAAGVVRGLASQIGEGFQFGGDFVVPPGFEGDTYPMRVNSGERVTVTPKSEVQETMRGGGGGGLEISGTINIYGAGGKEAFLEDLWQSLQRGQKTGALAGNL